MKFDGKAFGQNILDHLHTEILEKHLTPHLAVVVVGDDPASQTYVAQKKKKGEAIGITVTIYQLPTTVSQEELTHLIEKLNNDSSVHAIIIQRPFPKEASHLVAPPIKLSKDVDGFEENSPFIVPVVRATITILQEIYKHIHPGEFLEDSFFEWLKNNNIVVLGRGVTAGLPTIVYLESHDINPTVITSHTEDRESPIKQADIVITAVGKEHIITASSLKKGVILIGVGLTRSQEGKLVGDYNDIDVDLIASWYTPTPGGVGPINVAMLLKNVVEATKPKE